jgi:hypothetical protein
MPMTRSWAPTAADAILVIPIELVFVARIAWGGHSDANCLKIVALREGFSETASIMKSSDDNVEEDISVLEETRDLISSASFEVNRSFATSLASNESSSGKVQRELLINSRLFLIAAGSLSTSITSSFALRAAMRAIPSPYC